MHSHYLRGAFDKELRADSVAEGKKFLKQMKGCDTIAVRGISGLSIGSILAYEKNLNLTVVRKTTDSSHGEFQIESTDTVKSYVIVDDFISSGETVYHIVSAMKAQFPDAKCLGVFCYSPCHCSYSGEEFEKLVKDYVKNYPTTAENINKMYKKS